MNPRLTVSQQCARAAEKANTQQLAGSGSSLLFGTCDTCVALEQSVQFCAPQYKKDFLHFGVQCIYPYIRKGKKNQNKASNPEIPERPRQIPYPMCYEVKLCPFSQIGELLTTHTWQRNSVSPSERLFQQPKHSHMQHQSHQSRMFLFDLRIPMAQLDCS